MGLSLLALGNKRSSHSPGEGSTPLRKRSREDDVIELDADDGAPQKGSAPIALPVPPTPAPGKGSADNRRGPREAPLPAATHLHRGGTHRGSQPQSEN